MREGPASGAPVRRRRDEEAAWASSRLWFAEARMPTWHERDATWLESMGHGVPARFEAVVEHLVAGHDATDACAEVGRELARDGAGLGEALDGLQATWAHVLGGEPDFGAARALCEAWGEESLGYLHQLSCEDPLTGLASLAHLQARVSEVYRGAEQGGMSPGQSHALVLVDLPWLARPFGLGRPVRGHLATGAPGRDGPDRLPGRGVHREGQPFEAGHPRAEREPARPASGTAARSRRRTRP